MASVTVPACTLKPSLQTRSFCRGRISHSQAFKSLQPRRVIVRAEEPKEGEKEEAGSKAKDPVNKGGTAYIDELPVSAEARFNNSTGDLHQSGILSQHPT